MKTLVLLLSLLPFYCSSQTLPAIYTGSNYQSTYGESLTIGFDSSLFVTGTYYYDSVFIMKTDMNGIILKQIQLHGSMSSLEKTKDSSFISLYKNPAISNEITTLIKWDQNLDTLWTKSINFNDEIKSIHLSEMIDSTILISGVLSSNNLSFIMVVDSIGNLIWSKTLESQNVANLNYSEAKQQNDSTLLISSSNGVNTTITQLDLAGNVIWTNYFENFIARDFTTDNQGNIFAGGLNGIIILDSIGNFLKGKDPWGGYDQIYTLKNYMDTLVSFAYGDLAWHTGGWGSFIYIFDDSLNIHESINYLGGFSDFDIRDSTIYSLISGPVAGVKANPTFPHFEIEATIRPNNSCGYSPNVTPSTFSLTTLSDTVIFAVITPSDTITSTNLYPSTLIFESSCVGFTGSVDEYEENLIKIYPNPTSGILTIESEENKFIEKIEVLSMDGRIVFKKNHLKSISTTIDLSKLPSGIYYLKAFVEGSINVEKIVLN